MNTKAPKAEAETVASHALCFLRKLSVPQRKHPSVSDIPIARYVIMAPFGEQSTPYPLCAWHCLCGPTDLQVLDICHTLGNRPSCELLPILCQLLEPSRLFRAKISLQAAAGPGLRMVLIPFSFSWPHHHRPWNYLLRSRMLSSYASKNFPG